MIAVADDTVVTLPIARTLPPMDTAAPRYQAAAPTVLLADDEPPIVDLVTLILQSAGYTVLTCADGPSAVALFAQHADEIDLIITDLRLPDFAPGDFFKLTADSGLRVPPMLIFSGLFDFADLARLFETGLVHFLHKPFSIPALLREVQELIALGRPHGQS